MDCLFHRRRVRHRIAGDTHIDDLLCSIALHQRNENQRGRVVNKAAILSVGGNPDDRCPVSCDLQSLADYILSRPIAATNAWLTIETGSPAASSLSLNSRPESRAVRKVARYSGPTTPRSTSMDSFRRGR